MPVFRAQFADHPAFAVAPELAGKEEALRRGLPPTVSWTGGPSQRSISMMPSRHTARKSACSRWRSSASKAASGSGTSCDVIRCRAGWRNRTRRAVGMVNPDGVGPGVAPRCWSSRMLWLDPGACRRPSDRARTMSSEYVASLAQRMSSRSPCGARARLSKKRSLAFLGAGRGQLSRNLDVLLPILIHTSVRPANTATRTTKQQDDFGLDLHGRDGGPGRPAAVKQGSALGPTRFGKFPGGCTGE